ncbi:hypothetical protein ACN47E_003435 [Coniothyrium glycines]
MAVPTNNAFGAHSPSWNVSFPDGNLTAAEIIAYLPHWLKSVDVIDRFITNGGRSLTIAVMVNEFRDQPTAGVWTANSAQIMMSYAMRRAGFEGWTVGKHGEWPRAVDLQECNLSVKDFRTPRQTHPKCVAAKDPDAVAVNQEALPVHFRDLAISVKHHPSGPDALDLARCVRYALEHKHEQWLFPTDFGRLVIHLGGPAIVTHLHHDRQVFGRRAHLVSSPAKSSPKTQTRAAVSRSSIKRTIMGPPHMGSAPANDFFGAPANTSTKRAGEDISQMQPGSKRRSGRLAGKVINFREDSDAEVSDHLQPPRFEPPGFHFTGPPEGYLPSHLQSLLSFPENDSDFVAGQSETDDDVPEGDEATDDGDLTYKAPGQGRAAAYRARQSIQASFIDNKAPLKLKVGGLAALQDKSKFKSVPKYMTAEIAPEIMQAAKDFSNRQPVRLKPPVLSRDRLKVDSLSIYLYAADGCTTMAEMWESALSSTRFGGPRRSAPFRELHRLTDPDPLDVSDWAENIRWAKEQHKVFGSETWTEYGYHLEMITQHRMETFWVSEETIQAGM